jgi:hypothetical protein
MCKFYNRDELSRVDAYSSAVHSRVLQMVATGTIIIIIIIIIFVGRNRRRILYICIYIIYVYTVLWVSVGPERCSNDVLVYTATHIYIDIILCVVTLVPRTFDDLHM